MTKISSFCLSLSAFLLTTQFLGADESDALPPRDQGLWQTVIMIGIAMIFFYFILWRPEQKRRQAAEAQRSALKKGDRVTAMGIIGTILRVEDQTVILKMYDGSKIEVLKGAITDVAPGTDEDVKKVEKVDNKSKIERLDSDEQ